jgi:hypothetical protein
VPADALTGTRARALAALLPIVDHDRIAHAQWLSVRLDRDRIGTHVRPPPHVDDAIAHGLPHGSEDIMGAVKFPESVRPYDHGTAAPVLGRLGPQGG